MVVAVLFYTCPVHSIFTHYAQLGEHWERERACPYCGALSPCDPVLTNYKP